MGTRGAWGFVIDDELKVTYNHSDSYPTQLGMQLVAVFQALNMDEFKAIVRQLVLVNQTDKPTMKQIKQCQTAGAVDLTVSLQSVDAWYCLLRNAQGDMSKILDAGFMVDSHDFLRDGLFCEWAYIFDLDKRMFEVYRGFYKKKHNKGRFAKLPKLKSDSKYFPVALVAKYPLDAIPGDWADVVDRLCERN